MEIVEARPQALREASGMQYVLACDIGGTNCRFALVGVGADEEADILAYVTHRTASVVNEHAFVNLLNDFLRELHERYSIAVSRCAIAAAGPVHNNTISLTNHNLNISGDFVRNHTMLDDVLVLNDLVAIAYGVYYSRHHMPSLTLHLSLQEQGPYLVVAPGTGLGVATIYVRDGKPIVIPSEGGHIDFVPYDDMDRELIRFVQEERSSTAPLEFEDFISGRGIHNIFRFLISKESDKESIDVMHANMILQYNRDLVPRLIARYIPTNKLCRYTFDIFFRYLARFCKNMALANLTHGGIFIGGGMMEENQEYLNTDTFVIDMVEHSDPRFSDILAQIPLYLATTQHLGVRGAACAILER